LHFSDDVASVLPYPRIDLQKAMLSMKLGGEYRLRNITLHRWHQLAAELHVDPDAMTARVDSFAAQLADRASDITRRMTEEGIRHPIIARLAEAVVARAAACRKLLRTA
jgi:hypothetical protein